MSSSTPWVFGSRKSDCTASNGSLSIVFSRAQIFPLNLRKVLIHLHAVHRLAFDVF